MKVCNRCGEEFAGRDGENICQACGNKPFRKTKLRKRERESIVRSLGLTKVRGALGGTYWE